MDEEKVSIGERCAIFWLYHWRGVMLLVVPLSLLPLVFIEPVLENRCLWVLIVMAIFWISEAMPLAVTSVIPIVFFPPLGIMSSEAVCLAYFTDSLILFMGGLVVALTIEYSNLHKRVALSVILIVGCSPRKLHFSLLMVSMFVSMWINNASTTAMMCPVIKAVLEELEGAGMATLTTPKVPESADDPPYPSKIVICYYLGVAYASSVGGCGTLIGTGTNLVFLGIYETRFPKQNDVDFLNWMLFNVPPMLIHTILIFFWMQFQYMGLFRPNSVEGQEIKVGKEGAALAKQVMMQKRTEMGPLTCHEIQVAILFIVMIVLFFTSSPGVFSGWADFFNAKDIKNSFTVIMVVVLFFALPVSCVFMKYWICRKPDPEGTLGSLMKWSIIHAKLPWGVLLLLGGGFALSKGIVDSGLAKTLGDALSSADSIPPVLLQFLCILVGMVATAFTANMAMCNILVPVLQEMSVVIKIHPMFLTLPTTLALSMAFHLPVSTPCNAIASSYANIRTKSMIVGGIGPTIITLFGLFLSSQLWMRVVYPDAFSFPDWANDPKPEVAKAIPW